MKRLIYLLIALLTCTGNIYSQNLTDYLHLNFGSFSQNFTCTNTENSYNHASFHGTNSGDIVYQFTLTKAMNVVISHCGSTVSDTQLFLYDNLLHQLDTNDDNPDNDFCPNYHHAYLNNNLPAGTYYVISEGYDENGNITTTIAGSIPGGDGTSLSTALEVGTKKDYFYYSNTFNTNESNNTHIGISGKEAYYRFTLDCPMDITVSHCGSTIEDTYLTLYSPNGSVYLENDNSNDTNSCKGKQAYLKFYGLPTGTYYVISEGVAQNGLITTIIEGEPCGEERKGDSMENAIDIGSFSSNFIFRETLDSYYYQNNFYCDLDSNCQSSEDIFYQIELLRPLNLTIAIELDGNSSLHLLNRQGECIAHNHDGDVAAQPCFSEIKYPALPKGIYYIVCEGYGGSIPLMVEGKSPDYEPLTSRNKSHILTITPQIATSALNNVPPVQRLQTLHYFDGMGRPEETIQIGCTPEHNDLITYQEYDELDRATNSWLPTVVPDNEGMFITLETLRNKAQETYNQDTNPYSRIVYEHTPLNRILEQYGAGKDWYEKGKSVKTAYLTNQTGNDSLNCVWFAANGEMTDTLVSLIKKGNYATGELFVTRMEDEAGKVSFTFTDKLGHKILTRHKNGTAYQDTYYLYGDDELIAVIPPMAADYFSTSNDTLWNSANCTTLNDYAYLYCYDRRNRMHAKKLPGCSWNVFIHDTAGHLTFAQDGEQRKKEEWSFTLYDTFNRECVKGICKNAELSMQTLQLNSSIMVNRDNTAPLLKGYSIPFGLTLTQPEILSVNYYDDYSFLNQENIPELNDTSFDYQEEAGYNTRDTGSMKGKLTGTLTAILDGGSISGYLASAIYYDYRERVIQTRTSNHLAGTDKEFIAYDFTGKPIRKKLVHDGMELLTQEYTYTYDHAGRLLKTTHKLNEGEETVLVDNAFDALGRLKANYRNGVYPAKSEYAYNIRSWNTQIKSPLFEENLSYEYNGNIQMQQWKQNGNTKSYTFDYDGISRLIQATYTGYGNHGASYHYDKNGNITILNRYGIDNLALNYYGNQLVKVEDSTTSTTGFKDGAHLSKEYEYDMNGNLSKDLNKNITEISYNCLNLPQRLVINGYTYDYTYAANGKKLAVTGNDRQRDYIGNVIYENSSLKRILVDGGYYDCDSQMYCFHVQDHLGNNRLVVNEDAELLQSTEYYPFGMPFEESYANNVQPYKYNGKEFISDDALNLYDYGARYMDPTLGRFVSVDPMAEKTYSESPYGYCGGNPVLRIDKDGRIWDVFLDAAFILYDAGEAAYQYITDGKVSTTTKAALAADIAAAFIPVATGAGLAARAGVKEAEKATRITNSLKAMRRGVENEAKVLKDIGEVKNTAVKSANIPHTEEFIKTIPDAINEKYIIEIKDVKTLSNTKQIKAEREVAAREGKSLRIITGERTHISGNIKLEEVIRRKDLGPQIK